MTYRYICQNCGEKIGIGTHTCNLIQEHELGIFESLETTNDENNTLVQFKITRQFTDTQLKIDIVAPTSLEIETYITDNTPIANVL